MKIKHTFLFTLFFIAFSARVFSQDSFIDGTNMINFGVGFGNGYYSSYHGSGYSYGTTPVFTLSFDHGLENIEEIQGTIGLGGLAGFVTSHAESFYPNGNYSKDTWSDFILAARGTYHASFINSDNLDLYGGIMFGFRFESYTFTSNYGGAEGNYGGVHLTGGVFVGGAYYFTNTVGIFGELGYDVAYLKLGLTIKTGAHK